MIVQFKTEGTELNRVVKLLNVFIESDRVKCPGDVKKFIFLCGANRTNGQPSARRSELISFSEKNLQNCHFFLAELIFKELSQDDEAISDNLLDIESELSALADHILIILESYSSFTELGAFSYSKELRSKLIIVNNSKYIFEKSFINMGPIKAVSEAQQKGHFLHYKMSERPDSIDRVDGIGEIFSPLYKILSKKNRKQARTLKKESLNPAVRFDKDSIRFIHDVIFTCGSVRLQELIDILVALFGNDYSYKKGLLKHLGILKAINIIGHNEEYYFSAQRKYYFRYDFDIESISSIIKVYFLKNDPKRIYQA